MREECESTLGSPKEGPTSYLRPVYTLATPFNGWYRKLLAGA